MYSHRTAGRVAVAPTYPGIFREQVREAALIAMRSLPLAAHDSQLMRDLRREDGPYQFRAVDRLIDLLAQVPDECEALVFIEGLRGAITARRRRQESHNLLADALEEHALQCVADPLQLAVATDPHPDVALVRRALDATTRHESAEHRLRDGFYRLAFDLVHGGR